MPPGGFETSEEPDAEYMTVYPDEDFEGGQGGQDTQGQWRRGGPKNFVGGFVSGLKKLPRVVLRRPPRRGTGGTDGTGGTGDTLPTYQSPILTATPRAEDVLYVESSEMPTPHPAPAPPDAHSHHTDGRSHDGRSHHTDGRSYYAEERSYHADARSHHTDARSHHTDNHSHHTTHSVGHDSTYDTHVTVPITREYAPYEGMTAETGLGHDQVPAAARIPIPVELLPSADYNKMDSPLHSPSVTSLNSRFARIGRFFQDLHDLPWIATRITADYIPAEQSRARYARKAPTTWYPDVGHSPIDLLAQYTPPRRPYSPRENGYNPDRDYLPNSSATLAYHNARLEDRNRSPPQERSASRSHSHDRHRSRSPPYSRHAHYPGYPQGYAAEYVPQPLYMYPSAIPQAQAGMQSSAPNLVGQTQDQAPQMQQARPVYLVASSPPPFIPPPPDQIQAPRGAYYPYPVYPA